MDAKGQHCITWEKTVKSATHVDFLSPWISIDFYYEQGQLEDSELKKVDLAGRDQGLSILALFFMS